MITIPLIKVSSIVDDYLFNKETAKGGLKRKSEPENIICTKKSKKRLSLFMNKGLLLLSSDIVNERRVRSMQIF